MHLLYLIQPMKFRFYSKLVRLEESSGAPRSNVVEEFLFQIGAIRSQYDQPSYESYSSFYSKLVRLEVEWYWYVLIGFAWFLFQIGAIRSSIGHKKRSRDMSFYSKLVRLEVTPAVVVDQVHIRFYSKLVRLEEVLFGLHRRLDSVSIPNWCD